MTHTRIVTAARLLKTPALEAEAASKAPDLDRFVDPANREAYFTNQHLRDLYGFLIERVLKEPGLFVLVGEKGIGKTALVQRLGVEIERAGALVVRHEASGASFEPIGLALAETLDVAPPATQSLEILSDLREAVASRVHSGRPVVIVIDRAETLGADALHSLLVLLASPESVPSGIRIVLSGRPELAKRLALPAYAALLEQERWRGEITPLSEDDLASLVWHRLRRCGIAESHLLDERSIDELARLSKGVPGRAIAVARTALEQALAAGPSLVPPALAASAAQDMRTFPRPVAKSPRRRLGLGSGIVVTLLAAGIGLSLVLTSISNRVARVFDSIATTLAGPPRSPGNLTTSAQAGALDENAGTSRPETPLDTPAGAAQADTSDAPSPSAEQAQDAEAPPPLDAQQPRSTALDEPAAAAVEGSSREGDDRRAAGETRAREAGETHDSSTRSEPADGSRSAIPLRPPTEEEDRALPEPATRLQAPAGAPNEGQTGASLLDPEDVADAEFASPSFEPPPSVEEEAPDPPIQAAALATLPPATDRALAELPEDFLGAEATAGGDDSALVSTGISPEGEPVRPASTAPAIDPETPALHVSDPLKAVGDEASPDEAATPPLDALAAVVAEPADTVPAPPATIFDEADAMPPDAEALSAGVTLRAAPAAQPAQTPSPAEASESRPSPSRRTAMLVERGNALLERGDVSGARLLYVRAASAGDPDAAFAAGKTYDRKFLAQIRVQGGVRADPEKAAAWYRRAADLGSTEAFARLKAMTDGEPE